MKNPGFVHAGTPKISPKILHVFTAYCRRHLRKNFHGFRILKNGLPTDDPTRPLVVYFNHPSWWDPLICLQLASKLFPKRASFGPIEAAMLQRYGIFKHLGFFPVELDSIRGARHFLATAHSVLTPMKNALWITPQGRFVDVRERPLDLRSGLGALARREPHATYIPLAIEYAFWTESRPEILASFGEPTCPETEPPRSTDEWTQHFSESMERTQSLVAAASCRRDSAEWLNLADGRSGTIPIYDAWRWLRARWQGETFSTEHGR